MAQLVEHHLAKVRVASSNLVVRSRAKAPSIEGAFDVFRLPPFPLPPMTFVIADPWIRTADP